VTLSVLAGDSGTPRPGGYGAGVFEPSGRLAAFRAWGIYVGGAAVHIWTRAEAAALHEAGIEGAFPIVVPPQSWPWIMPEDEVLVDLVREAEAWGVPHGAPLILDLEEWQAERMGSQLGNVVALFAGASRAARFSPVVYGSRRTLYAARGAGLFLAAWTRPSGENPPPMPDIPAGLFAWQYAGNAPGPAGAIDLDVLAVPATLMATDFSVPSGLVTITEEGAISVPVLIPKPPAKPEPVAAPKPEPVAPEKPAEKAPESATAAESPVGRDAPAKPANVARLFLGGSDNYCDIATVGDGYWALTEFGRIEAVRLPHLGEPGPGAVRCVAIAATPSGHGYFVLTAGGDLYHYGDAGSAKAADVSEAPTDA
jgi:hypothetical protein